MHCALFNLLVLAAYGLAFWIWCDPALAARAGLDDPVDRVAFVLACGLLLGWISGVNVGVNFHNHAHCPIFRSPRLNRWFERVWTFSGGWPAFYWAHSHVTVHHAHLLGADDWTMPRRRPDGRFESIYRYVLCHWPWRFLPHLWRDFTGGPQALRRRALVEGAWFVALWSIPFWIDPWMGLWLWLLPQWVANAVIMGAGMYVQHAGCGPVDEAGAHRHSTTFTSAFFNLTMFNIGYHVEHHDHAGVHWSALPRCHARLEQQHLEAGAHVVPYGYYHAAHLCARLSSPEAGFRRFVADQAAGYERPHALVPVPRVPGTTPDDDPQSRSLRLPHAPPDAAGAVRPALEPHALDAADPVGR